MAKRTLIAGGTVISVDPRLGDLEGANGARLGGYSIPQPYEAAETA